MLVPSWKIFMLHPPEKHQSGALFSKTSLVFSYINEVCKEDKDRWSVTLDAVLYEHFCCYIKINRTNQNLFNCLQSNKEGKKTCRPHLPFLHLNSQLWYHLLAQHHILWFGNTLLYNVVQTALSAPRGPLWASLESCVRWERPQNRTLPWNLFISTSACFTCDPSNCLSPRPSLFLSLSLSISSQGALSLFLFDLVGHYVLGFPRCSQ